MVKQLLINKNKSMQEITVNGVLLFTLYSKQEWINKIPRILPEKEYWEQLLWLDTNNNILTIGEDFATAEKIHSYPVKVYRLQRVATAK